MAYPQLDAIQRELEEITKKWQGLAAGLSDAEWTQRPPNSGWSAAECLTHLTITTRAFLPRLQKVIRDAREKGLKSDGPYRQDFKGRLLCWFIEPPYWFKVKTPPGFAPQVIEPIAKALTDFSGEQAKLVTCVKDARGLAIDRLQIQSPFSEKMQYTLLTAFRVLAAHQRRHLWQAENILKEIGVR